MAHADCLPTYQLKLTAEEFRLITLALAGKLDEHEKAEALELNVHLCRIRAHHLRGQADAAAKALESAEIMQNPNIPPTIK